MNKLVEMTGIDKFFPGVHALKRVQFDLMSGEVHALMGENGAGKSTLVGMVAGRIEATRGQVHFKGQDITAMPRRHLAKGVTLLNGHKIKPCKSLVPGLGRETVPTNRDGIGNVARHRKTVR